MSIPSLQMYILSSLDDSQLEEAGTIPTLSKETKTRIHKRLGAPKHITIWKMPFRLITDDCFDQILDENYIGAEDKHKYIDDFNREGRDYQTITDLGLNDTRAPEDRYTEYQINFRSLLADIRRPWSEIEQKYGILEPGLEGGAIDMAIWPKELWVAYKTNEAITSDPTKKIIPTYKHYDQMSLRELEDDGY